jgi:hypothetical protein
MKNACPYCRSHPFCIRYEYDVHPEVERRKARLKEKSAPPKKLIACKAYRCDYIDVYENILIHR